MQAGKRVLQLMGTIIELYVAHPEYEQLLNSAEASL